MIKAIASALGASEEPLGKDSHLAASLAQGAMSGVSLRLLESANPEKHYQPLKRELALMVVAYPRNLRQERTLTVPNEF